MKTQEYKKMVLVLYACLGAEEHEFYNVPVGVSEKELGSYAWERAVEFAERYGIYPEPDFVDDDEEYPDEYSSDISGHWEEYDPEKHDGHTTSGTPSWQDF